MELQGRSAIVTGAARGIGRAIALELARQGCDVAFNYSQSAGAAEELAAEIQGLGRRAYWRQVDAASFADVETMVQETRDQFGRIDYLVNNAGITRDKLLLRMREADWDEVIGVNLKGAFNFSRAAAGFMIRARFGSILSITSVSGIVGMPGQANYSAAKAGLIGLTKSMAKELAARNVTVNALALGLIDTDMTRGLSDDYKSRMTEAIPLKRFGTAGEVARFAAFLLSDHARYLTGQVVQLDGGLAM
jgi:3-oxoacyl-[acyl-carrier protein] reductase